MKEKRKIIAVLEIAGASVGGLLLKQNKNDRPQIISSQRAPVNFLFDVNFDAFWRCTRASLKKVMETLLKDCPRGPGACLCVLSSPWFLSQIKIINARREKSFKITKEFFENLIKLEEENFRVKAEALWKSDPEFIEREIVKTELNGYETKSAIGKIAKTVKMHIYLSAAMKKNKIKIEEQILENFGDIKLSFKTFPSVVSRILNGVVENQKELILLDIGGEITDIFFIKGNSLEETASFSCGENSLLRKISSEFNTFPQETSSILKTYLRGHSLKKDAERILKPTGKFLAVIPSEGGFAYWLGRQFTSKRIFEKRYKQSYKPFITAEHVNTANEIIHELKNVFCIAQTTFYPLGFLKSFHTCLFIGLCMTKKQIKDGKEYNNG